ncbi:MAG: IreB family regulatory phosphoprotein [Firmicutes bacterium]|nr:IreB family regulatory phosphoprotein [Bacillota bacterium]
MAASLNETQKFTNTEKVVKNQNNLILTQVYEALVDKGYNPVNQIVGYILSGDPTYITGHNNARNLICKVERDELLEELVTFYIQKNM